MNKYAETIRSLHLLNVSEDEAYQRTFNGLYRVRRNAKWRTHFYDLLEKHKDGESVSFGFVLDELYARTGLVEASFASKLLATIDPNFPVYDSVVRKNLGLPIRHARNPDRKHLLELDYEVIQAHSSQQRDAPRFRHLRDAFDAHFPDFHYFSDTKVLDLLIWQAR